MLELDALSVDLEQRAGFLFVKRDAQVLFERGHLVEQLANAVVHEWLRLR
jgi:hypothetical protein